MVKVRNSQIPEEDGKPIRKKTKTFKKPKSKKPSFDEDNEMEDDEEDSDGNFFGKKKSDDDSDEKQVVKTVVHFEDFGLVISIWDLASITKDIRFVEKPKAHWQYGITINKDMEVSMRYPIVDKSLWFEDEYTRDKRYDNIMKKLDELGFKVISI